MKPTKLDNHITGKDIADLDSINPTRNNLTKVLPSLLAPISNENSNGDFTKSDGMDKSVPLSDITKTPTHPRIRSDSIDSIRKDGLTKSDIPKILGEDGILSQFDPGLAHTPEFRKSKSLTRKIKQLTQRIDSPLNSELLTIDKPIKSITNINPAIRTPSGEPQKDIENMFIRESPVNIPINSTNLSTNTTPLPRAGKTPNPPHLSALKFPNHIPTNVTLEKITPSSPFTSLIATETEEQPALYQHFSLPKSISTTPKPANIISTSSPSISQNKSRSIAPKGNIEFVFVENSLPVNEKLDKASENDKVLQDRLNQAKALSRKEEDGATMHKFSLWNKKKPSTEVEPKCKFSGVKLTEEIDQSNQNTSQIQSKSNHFIPKYSTIKVDQNHSSNLDSRPSNDLEMLITSFTDDPSRDSHADISFHTNTIISENNSFVDRIISTNSEGGESYSDDDFEKLEDGPDNTTHDGSESFKSSNLSSASIKSQSISSKGLANSLRSKVVIAKSINPSEPSPSQPSQSLPSNPYSIPSASMQPPIASSSRAFDIGLEKKLSFTETLDVCDETELSYSSFSKKNQVNDAKLNDPFHSIEAEIPFIEDQLSDYSIEEEEITMLGLTRSQSMDKFENESLASIQTLMSRSGPACFSSLELSHNIDKAHTYSSSLKNEGLETSSQKIASNAYENEQRRASSTGFESRKKSSTTNEARIVRSMTSRVKFEKNEINEKKEVKQQIRNGHKRGTKVSKYQVLRNLKSSSQNKSCEKLNDPDISLQPPFPMPLQSPDILANDATQPNPLLGSEVNTLNHSQASLLSNDSPNLSEVSDSETEFGNINSSTNNSSNKNSLGNISIIEDNEILEQSESTTLAHSPLKWKKGEIIGEGTFGKVFKGLNEKTGELLAIKQLCLADGSDVEVIELQKEISVMWELDHEHIVRYYGTSKTDRFLFIILEYVTGGSIANMLNQFGAFSENLIKRFSFHILSGIEYLHSKGIIHRDIKGANILVTDTGVAKLADFGCSKRLAGLCTMSLEESMNILKGSVPWMAPEVIKNASYGRSSDIWSFGATVIEMATGKPPWSDYSDNLAALFKIATSTEPPAVPSHLSEGCGDFINKCLVINPDNRSTAHQLLREAKFLKSEVDKVYHPTEISKKDVNTPSSNSFRKRFSNIKHP